MSVRAAGWLMFLIVAVLGASADLITKEVAFSGLGMPGSGRRLILVPDVLVFETNLNEGALFGMGQGLSWLFAGISIAALVGIVAMLVKGTVLQDRWLVAALGLVVGGIIGNLVDRLGLPGLRWHAPPERFGEPVRAVRDWIHVTVPGVIDWPIFNLADTWLVIGAGLLLLVSLRPPRPGDAVCRASTDVGPGAAPPPD